MAVKIVLIGAGSAQFGYDMLGDIFQSKALAGCHVELYDINAEALAIVEKNGRRFLEEQQLPFTLTATTDRKQALQKANFCIISIEVGDRFKLMEQDWRIPLQFGIRQSMGENGGPGGLFHSLRIIPPILEICEDIRNICPDALVFNFSNPMSRICTTVHRRFPELKLVGLCHEIESLGQHLPLILDTPWENLKTRAGGLNHFSILIEATYVDSGRDAYPDIRKKAPQHYKNLPKLRDVIRELRGMEAGSTPGSEPAFRAGAGEWSERGIFKALLEQYGYMPITTDSHLGEYIAWANDAADHKGILDFYQYYLEYLDKAPQIELKLHERAVPIMDGILTDSGYEEAAVNLPNDNLIAALPAFMAVEVPAIIDKNGVTGVRLDNYPAGFAGHLCNQVGVHNLTAEAVLNQSKELALQALLVDPTVAKYASAIDLFRYMLVIQEPYLRYLK
ncbi:alpha-glucosidase [bacterium]|nr:alpha-glucosidase [bacterium]